MHSMNDRDKEILYQKVCELHAEGTCSDCFKPIDALKDSYYEKADTQDVQIHEYTVGNVPAFLEELEKLWAGQALRELIPVVAASAFKAKESILEKEREMEEIPHYIYNF